MPITNTLGSTSIVTRLSSTITRDVGGETMQFAVSPSVTLSFTHGTGQNQAEMTAKVADTASTSASAVTAAVTDFDLTAFPGPFGTVQFDSIKALILVNQSTTAGQTIVIGGGTNPWTGPLGGTSPTYTLPVGNTPVVWACPDATGWVVDSTHKTLRLRASAGTPSYTLHIIGTVA